MYVCFLLNQVSCLSTGYFGLWLKNLWPSVTKLWQGSENPQQNAFISLSLWIRHERGGLREGIQLLMATWASLAFVSSFQTTFKSCSLTWQFITEWHKEGSFMVHLRWKLQVRKVIIHFTSTNWGVIHHHNNNNNDNNNNNKLHIALCTKCFTKKVKSHKEFYKNIQSGWQA